MAHTPDWSCCLCQALFPLKCTAARHTVFSQSLHTVPGRYCLFFVFIVWRTGIGIRVSSGIPRTCADSGWEHYLVTVNFLNKASRVGECEHTAQGDSEMETVLASKCGTSLFTKRGQHSNNLSPGSLSDIYALCSCIHGCFLPVSAILYPNQELAEAVWIISPGSVPSSPLCLRTYSTCRPRTASSNQILLHWLQWSPKRKKKDI